MRNREGVLLSLPIILFLILLVSVPMVLLLFLSVSDWDISQRYIDATFVGFRNFRNLFIDYRFLSDGLTTLYWVFGCLVIELPLGLGISLLLKAGGDRRLPGMKVFQTLFLLSLAVAPVVTAVMWRLMYNGSIGIINFLLESIGLEGQEWLSNTSLAMPALIITDVWEYTPLFILLLYAAIETVPKEIEEVASIDGANYWQKLFHIILPTIKATIFVAVVIRTIDLLRWIVTNLIMTGGGPGIKTETWNVLLYYTAFWQFELDKAAALGTILLTIGALFAFFAMKVFFRKETINRKEQ